MNCIPVPTDIAFTLIDEASRRRALSDAESILLEQIVTRGHQSQAIRITWTPKLDRALWRASHIKGEIRMFAEKNGFSPMACHKRIAALRERKAARQGKLPCSGRKG